MEKGKGNHSREETGGQGEEEVGGRKRKNKRGERGRRGGICFILKFGIRTISPSPPPKCSDYRYVAPTLVRRGDLAGRPIPPQMTFPHPTHETV